MPLIIDSFVYVNSLCFAPPASAFVPSSLTRFVPSERVVVSIFEEMCLPRICCECDVIAEMIVRTHSLYIVVTVHGFMVSQKRELDHAFGIQLVPWILSHLSLLAPCYHKLI